MILSTRFHSRPWLLVVLALTLIVLLSGCALPVASGTELGVRAGPGLPPGLTVRAVRTVGRVVPAVLPALDGDSLEVTGAWTLPPPAAGGQWGPIQSLRVCAVGGAFTPPAGPGDPSPADCRTMPGTATGAVIRLPFDLSGLGDLTGSVWHVRMCVTTTRHNRDGPQVCGDHEFPLDAPAPAGVTGLTVTSRVISPP